METCQYGAVRGTCSGCVSRYFFELFVGNYCFIKREIFEYNSFNLHVKGAKIMPVYNKLVRDKILEIIEADGLAYNARILESNELLKEVKAEANEFHAADTTHESVEELADVLELVHTAISALGVTYEELEAIREQKKAKRGGFEKGIYLIDVEDK